MNPLVIALDCESAAEARSIVRATRDTVDIYKVGLELYAAAGPKFVKDLIDNGKRVFLDLKLHDIGETVKRATERIAEMGVTFLTVHAEPQVMRAAVAGRGRSKLKILGVTILTSLDQTDLHQMGYTEPMGALFDRRVRNAVRAGLDGLICSPLEVERVRAMTTPKTILITPGVRSPGAAKGDQKRVATPAEAIRAGANYLVIGRQVTKADDPAAAVKRILAEIRAGRPKK
ncbi:MAG: orotidine-5'-phosphate decarboxylase [Acidobacteria bacterium]|nr:orotidine-5'-phosphate decarboxylase [Acidobacteriota bacterium]